MHPLLITLPEIETFDPEKSEFSILGGETIELEYSLYTVSLWESKWKKPFMTTMDNLTTGEEIGLFEAMCITEGIPKHTWGLLTRDIRKDIFDYLKDPMSATTITNRKSKPGKAQIITTEIIYYWMSSLNIPYSCERWHFNRLMKLIEVSFIKQSPPQKMSKTDAFKQQRELNALRRARLNTKG